MKMGLIVIISFLFTSPITYVNAQQQIFKNYTVNDGLVSNSIRRIFQDSRGFLWIGTMEGLSKYDGNSFTNFTTANGLSHNLVNDFYESPGGRLFVAFNNGSIDEIKDDKVIHVKSKENIVVNRFYKTPWHQVIVVTDSNGIHNFHDGKLMKPPQELPKSTFLSVSFLSDTSFAATDNTFLKVFNKNLKLLSEIKIAESIYSESRCFKDSKGRLWVISSYGIKLIHFVPDSNPRLLNADLPSAFKFLNKYSISDIYEDVSGSMWLATSTGIIKINPAGSHQIFTVKDGIVSNIITTIFQDKEKNIWFGTAVGLSKLVTKSGISLFPIKNGVWQNDNQFLMYPYKAGHLLVSTSQGTKDFDKKTGSFSDAFKNSNDLFYKAVPNTNPLIITGVNNSITIDTPLFQPHIIPALSNPSNVRIFMKDKVGNSFAYNIHFLSFISETGQHKIIDDRVSDMLIDKSDYLWAGTWTNGLIRIRYRVFNKDIEILEKRCFLPGINIRSLYEDKKGNIWAGSRYDGVFRLTENVKDSFKILNINQSNGLTSNFVKSIREDDDGNIWIAFFQGLDKLIPHNQKFQIFNFSRINNFFTSIIGMETGEDNLLWLATAEGIVKIKDGKLERLLPLPVYITKIYSSDTTYPPHSKQLKFNYDQKELLFEFSSPSFINEKQIFYSYRLKGNNETEWSKPNNQHSISYAGLMPGKYQFQVKTLGWNGSWGLPAIVDFEITPPFWQTWWFILVGFIAIISLTTWLVRRRITIVRHEADLKRRIAETEMMALRAQMNPHFIFNCINSIDALIQDNDKYHATIYLNKFAKLIRNILDSSKQITVSLSKDLDTLKLYIELEQFRHEDKFIAEIKVDNDVLQDDYKIPPLIVQPFVENAIQHGLRYRPDKNGKLSIIINKTQNYLEYIIEDNGVGREIKTEETRKEKISYGISMSSERVRMFNKEESASVKIHDLYACNNKPSGTRVEVRLNIHSC